MAGDWIPMRVDLQDDPAVIHIGVSLGMDEYAVVGRLHRLWSWANRHLAEGATTVTQEWVDRYVGHPGFAAAMIGAGWLSAAEMGVTFPRFDRWNSQGAKRRLEATQRKQKQRVTEVSHEKRDAGHASGGTKARPEKRREEKREEPPTPGGGAVADDPPEEVVDAAGTMIRPEPLTALIEAWVAAKLPGRDAPGGIRENGHRRGLFEQRQRNPLWRKSWREAVARLGRSQRAQGGRPGFEQGIRLDTFLKDEGLLDRILEGDWDDRGGAGRDPPERPSGPSKMLDVGMMDGMKMPGSRPFASAYRGGGSHGF